MNQLRSELEVDAPAVRPSGAPADGPVLSGARVDRLLAKPVSGPESPNETHPPSMYGIWLGAVAGTAFWVAVAVLLLLLL